MAPYLNVEIKAACNDPSKIRKYLMENGAEFRGTDEQTDTYFNTPKGRLKLREGNIENNLIYYERDDLAGPKSSHFNLVKVMDPTAMKETLTRCLGIKVIIKKKREIYYIRNVKFHLDEIEGLGSFVEIEAGNLLLPLSPQELKEQCVYYLTQFGIRPADMIKTSYSDMLLANPLLKT
ncbi:MAG TPA: class IV adenylate cyclase [Chitinophagaceae bacterium]|nr:class IV adenylate cyclase [Chitinophagaceae bacterium]